MAQSVKLTFGLQIFARIEVTFCCTQCSIDYVCVKNNCFICDEKLDVRCSPGEKTTILPFVSPNLLPSLWAKYRIEKGTMSNYVRFGNIHMTDKVATRARMRQKLKRFPCFYMECFLT